MLFVSIGLKKSFRVCWKYPALVLTPAFGTRTFGPVQRSQCLSNCCPRNERNSINVSFFHTWINYAITLAGMAAFFVAEVESYDCLKRGSYNYRGRSYTYRPRFPCFRLKGMQSKYSGFFELLHDTFVNGKFKLNDNRGEAYVTYIFISWILLLFCLPIFIGFLQAVEKCCCCLYEPCQIKCLPVIQKTKLNVENMEHGEENNNEESTV